MIVVSDTSPVIALRKIGLLSLLPAMFETVIVPAAVAEELARGIGKEGVDVVAENPWMVVRSPRVEPEAGRLGAGETAAIALALEMRPHFLLIDDRGGRKEAEKCRVRAIGTVGVLELAAVNGLVDLESSFDLLRQTDFRVSGKFLDDRLQRCRSHQSGGSAS